MQLLLPKLNVSYVGGDIVKTLIELNNTKYRTDDIAFVQIDLIKDNLPKS
jgi:hypothetical protein